MNDGSLVGKPKALTSPAMKVGFILLSSPEHPIPSTRVAALNMLPLLEKLGVRCEILYAPSIASERPELSLSADDIAAQGFDVVCFQKIHGRSACALAAALRKRGVGTIFLVCDAVDIEMCEAADITVTVTEYLRSLYPSRLQHKIQVVHDGIECPDIEKTESQYSDSRTVNAVLVTSAHLTEVPVIGMPPSWLRITIVGPYAANRRDRLREDWWTLQKLRGWRLRVSFLCFLVSPRIRRIRWSPAGVYDELVKADVGIIPIQAGSANRVDNADIPLWKRKSENRLTLKMAVGLPVVATPIPAYEPVIRQGANGRLVQHRADWITALKALRDPELRRRVGAQARSDVLDRYSMHMQSLLLRDALVAAAQAASADPQGSSRPTARLPG